MPRRLRDRHAGALPVIRSEGDSVIFHISIPGLPRTRTLVIRCDDWGHVWVSVAGAESPGEKGPAEA